MPLLPPDTTPRTPAVIRDWDRRTVEEHRMPSILLMENAGAGAARILLDLARQEPERWREPWTILCGPGNNGGDGFVVARHLHNAGLDVEVWLAFDPARLKAGRDNTAQWRILETLGVRREGGEPPFPAPPALEGDAPCTVVDALLGTGLSRPLEGHLRTWVEALARSPWPVASLDIPSGLDGTSGEILGAAVRAEHTLTFAAPKTGFERAGGPSCCGRVWTVDIGMPREVRG